MTQIKYYYIIYMTTFKEISVEDYKKLLNNKLHTFAKTFKNIELLQKFENRKLKNDDINDIIYDEQKLEKEDKYIEKLTDKLSEKINKNNGELLSIHNNDKESVIYFVKNIYIKYKHASIYKPRNDDIVEVSLESIMNSIKNNQNIGKSDRENIYNIYKTNSNLKDVSIDYNDYKNALEDIEKIRNVDITKDIRTKSKSLPSTSNKSLIPKIKENISKTIIEKITGQGYNKIKIDQDLLKKNILKVRYISNNRKVHNDLLKDDYKISDNMKNAILKNKNINKLSKDEYAVYNALQKYKNNDKLQLLISSYIAGNKSKDQNKINEMLYNNYKNNRITKKEYQNIINKI